MITYHNALAYAFLTYINRQANHKPAEIKGKIGGWLAGGGHLTSSVKPDESLSIRLKIALAVAAMIARPSSSSFPDVRPGLQPESSEWFLGLV
ncbi:hypothetical protein HRbin01_00712 [archaeon HR01]|nr:hypothetical protein HRbin01_00712 [archaeon HR01]